MTRYIMITQHGSWYYVWETDDDSETVAITQEEGERLIDKWISEHRKVWMEWDPIGGFTDFMVE